MSRSDFLAGIRLSRSFPCLISRTALLSDPSGSQLFHLTHFPFIIINLAELFDPGRAVPVLASNDLYGFACDIHDYIGLSSCYNYFGTQSLQLNTFGSVAPSPTLRPNVTVLAPRTWYGRLVKPYPAGLCSCYTLTVYKGRLPAYQWNGSRRSQFAP